MKPFNDVKQTINAALSLTVTIVILVLIISLLVTKVISNRITEPVTTLLDLTTAIQRKELNRSTTDIREQMGKTFAEADALLRVYEKMFTVIRLANASFFEQDLKAANKLMVDAQSLFTSLDDRRGLGVSDNNMGAIRFAAGH